MITTPRTPYRFRRAAPAALMLGLSLLTGGCGIGNWFGDSEDAPLPGRRVSVLQLERQLEPDPATRGQSLTVPAPNRNPEWPQAGGYPHNAMGHLALGPQPRLAWRASAGAGSDSTNRLLSRPVVADGRVYTMDVDATVSAVDAGTGGRLWHAALKPEEEGGDSVGGGIAFEGGRLYAATAFGEVVALEAGSGQVLWRHRIPGPARGAPAISAGRVFVMTRDNRTLALATDDGAELWSHTGIMETAGILGVVSPAVDGGMVIIPYSSGELFALQVETGQVAWVESLASAKRSAQIHTLSDIQGLPVIDGPLVIAVGHGGRMIAVDRRAGGRVWEQQIGGVDTPWVAGDSLFVLTNENQVTAIARQSGAVRWVTQLERYEDEEDRAGRIVWAGPVLAGGHLWLAGSTGKLVALAPGNGAVETRLDLPGAVYISPVVADGTLFVLTEDATLVALR